MKIYTDGSYNRKISPKTAAYAAAIVVEETNDEYICDIIYGISQDPAYVNLWNVGGEILGVISAIDYVKLTYQPKDITILHDYTGLMQWANLAWQAKTPTTQAYVHYIDTARKECNITFIHVHSHRGNALNEVCDSYANLATRTFLDTGREISLQNMIHISKH